MLGSIVFQLIILVLVFAFATYACVFADPETSDVGRFCIIKLPSCILKWLEIILGQKLLNQLSTLMDHGFQMIYLVVVLGSWSIVFAYGYPEIEKSSYVHSCHQLIGYAVFVACMASWYYACHVGPGNVTARTISLFDHYEYDNVLYSDKLCPTLKIRKIARSKYDRSSQRHVPRFDHYCSWLNQAVGERNYRWFLLFLAVHVFMCWYGTWVMASVMYGEMLEKDLLNATFFNVATGVEVKADFVIVFHYLFRRHFQLCGVLLLMSVMGATLGIFLGFHLYITSLNMTTNEYFKWRSVKRWHRKERLKYEAAMKDGMKVKKCDSALLSQQVPDGDVGSVGASAGEPPSDIIADDVIFDPGPMPKNIYNKGIILNFAEVLFPLSSRDEAILRYRTTLRHDSDNDCSNQKCSSDEKRLKPKVT
ncbi:hypothetical protein ACHAW5_005540 [Stephanodiscus triporus]|uniref:Palmitoyltransferase n=1 Tax=Stephanodiscus triporus TaxID=2934178 RepID=A0ABD3MZ17_9STRA